MGYCLALRAGIAAVATIAADIANKPGRLRLRRVWRLLMPAGALRLRLGLLRGQNVWRMPAIADAERIHAVFAERIRMDLTPIM